MGLEEKIMETIDQQGWLDDLSKKVQDAVYSLYDSGGEVGLKIRDFLHGVWLGHSLHATLTDVPIGMYTASLALDGLEASTGHDGFGAGADALLGAGIGSSVVTAAAGITDWHHTMGHARRVGMLHALLNTTSLGFYVASFLVRRSGKRGGGRALSLAGFGLSMAAAYLGGHLVYREGVGVNHAPDPQALPKRFTAVMAEADLPDGQPVRVDVESVPLLLVRRGRRVYALADRCAHLGGPLSEGELKDDNSIVCPWHGSRFALEDGHLMQGPSTFDQPCFETRIYQGMIEVRSVPKESAQSTRAAAPAPVATLPSQEAGND